MQNRIKCYARWHLTERYMKKLLWQKSRLKDILLDIILDPQHCFPLCITAFQVDRNVSMEDF